MKPQTTVQQMKEAVKKSGYPLELRVANKLLSSGFTVSPSHHFFDKESQKDHEIDIHASLNQKYEVQNGTPFTLTLNIAVECKDTSLPFVCFSLKKNAEPQSGILDADIFRYHINTSRDKGMPNRFAYALFSSINDTDDKFKRRLHPFSRDERHYLIAALEKNKLHVPEKLHNALRNIALFVATLDANTLEVYNSGFVAEEKFGLNVHIIFAMLIHSGVHYRYSIEYDTVEESMLTPVFLSYGYPNKSVYFILDLVSEDHLEEAIKHIQTDADLIVKHIYKFIIGSR